MKTLKTILLREPSAPAYWLAMGLLIKGIIPFIWLLHSKPVCEIPGFWGGTGGDTASYLMPIDTWLARRVYSPDFRMPGYGIVYLFFRLFFQTAGAYNCLIILQYLLASVTVYYLALTARRLFKNDKFFHITFYLYLISNFPNFYDGYILTESLCTAFFIFSVYFFVTYFSSKKILHLLLSCVFLGWAIFIRPGFALLMPVFAGVIVFQQQGAIVKNLKYGLLFIVPFLVVDGIWTYRNYEVKNKIIPLTYIGNYPNISSSYLEPMYYFVQSWGGGYSFTKNIVDLDWFEYTYPTRIMPAKIDSLSDDIYTSKYNKDSLLHLKKLIIALKNPSLDTNIAAVYQKELIMKFNSYKKSYQKERPFDYYVLTPLKLSGIILAGTYTGKFLNRGQTLGPLNPLLRVASYILYFGILLFGIVGMFTLLFKGFRKNILFVFLALLPIYTIFIHAAVLRVPDNRFIMPVWPFIVISAGYVISLFSDRFFGTSEKQQKR